MLRLSASTAEGAIEIAQAELHSRIRKNMMPPQTDRKEFAERRRFGAEYLARIARATVDQRKGIFAEWAEKVYDQYCESRIGLMKSSYDLPVLLNDLALYHSATVIPLLAAGRPNESESEAIRLAIAGRNSEWLARIAELFPSPEANLETSDFAVPERRRGYRKEVRQWMARQGVRVLPDASKRLGVSLSTLKSIMSDRGEHRYSEATLTEVFQKIGYQVE